VEKLRQLFVETGVLLGVPDKRRTSISHGPVSNIRNKNSPPNVRPPVYRGPSLHDGDSEEGEHVFGTGVAVVAADGDEGYEHVDGDHEGGESGEQAEDQEDSADEFCEGGDVAEPGGKPEGCDEVCVMVERAVGDDFGIAVVDHRSAKDDAKEERAAGLQAVEPLNHGLSVDGGLEDWDESLVGGCRGRYEGGDGCGGEVLV
jgi:hypothetical protein